MPEIKDTFHIKLGNIRKLSLFVSAINPSAASANYFGGDSLWSRLPKFF